MSHTETHAQRLTLYCTETTRHEGQALFEWLVQQALQLEMHGATAQKALCGFGQHHRVRHQHLIDLADSLPITVQIVDTPDNITRFLDMTAAAITQCTYTLEKVQCHTPEP